MTDLPTVGDYMATTLLTFMPDDNIHFVVETLLEKRLSGAPVVDGDGNLQGVISKKDCLTVVYTGSYHQDWGGTVAQYMNKDVHTMDANMDIIAAADKFVQSNYRRFPVMSEGKLVGQISRHDILRALNDQWAG